MLGEMAYRTFKGIYNLELLTLLTNKQTILNFLIISVFCLSTIIFAIAFFWQNREDILLKVGGVLVVSVLAFLSDEVGVYALSIFIVATFITKLDFLENLAALFWGRSEFWIIKKKFI